MDSPFHRRPETEGSDTPPRLGVGPRPSRRVILSGLAAGASAVTSAGRVAAAGSTLRVLVGFPAGGGLDAMVRIVAEAIRQTRNSPVVIENRPGAAGRIAAEALVRSEPDGSVILAAPIVATAFYPFIFKDLRFDPLTDLAPITRLSTFQFALAVDPRLPVDSLASFIAYAKQHPGRLSFGSLGAGTPSHFLGLLLNQAAGTDLVHVPYRGSAPALTDLIGGTIAAVVDTTASLVEQSRAGTVRLLAVTGTERSPSLPNVPTFGETKLGLGELEAADLWYGFFAPGGTPVAVIDGLNAEIRRALDEPAVRSRLATLDVTVATDTPAAFAARIRADHERWGRIIRASGFSAE